MNVPAQLSRLWQIAGADRPDAERTWQTTFEAVGLMLTVPPRHGGYGCTPTNSVAFAHTGGDGVHFSWLVLPSRAIDFAPIVMTVPMAFDQPNIILGASIREFLCLGRRVGYFGLEGLAYDAQRTLDAIAAANFESEVVGEEGELLQRLRRSVELEPWQNPHERFAALQAQYLPMVVSAAPQDVA